MKRIPGIALMVCLALLAAPAAPAAGGKLPPVYRGLQFDVNYSNEVVGTLNVNTNAWTHVLNAHGLEPGRNYSAVRTRAIPLVDGHLVALVGDDDRGGWHI